MKKLFAIAFLMLLTSCGQTDHFDTVVGPQGVPGSDGSSCTIVQVDGGANVTCGSNTVFLPIAPPALAPVCKFIVSGFYDSAVNGVYIYQGRGYEPSPGADLPYWMAGNGSVLLPYYFKPECGFSFQDAWMLMNSSQADGAAGTAPSYVTSNSDPTVASDWYVSETFWTPWGAMGTGTVRTSPSDCVLPDNLWNPEY